MASDRPRTSAEAMELALDWAAGIRSYTNLMHENPDRYPADVVAVMDAQEVVKWAGLAASMHEIEFRRRGDMASSSTASWARKGLDLLLTEHEGANVIEVKAGTPWISVVLRGGDEVRKFAIWRVTGCVYRENADGSVEDDPFLIPQGSPYSTSDPIGNELQDHGD